MEKKYIILIFALAGAALVLILSPSSLAKEIDAYLKENKFQGTALIASKGKVIFNKGYGLANIEHQAANTPETVFRIGSITKLFTAVAILQLQEKGLLKVTDPISKHLPEYPHGYQITIHHLLCHTSGIFSITRLPNLLEIQRIETTPEKAMAYFKNIPLLFPPGSDCQSSDSNYIVLGAIIENVSHSSYEDYLNDHIFIPLGLTSTHFESNDKIIPLQAAGYRYREGKLTHHAYLDMSLPHAAGSLVSTVEDLYLFERALMGDDFISKEMKEALFIIHGSNASNKLASGYGFRIGPLNRGMEGCEPSIAGHFATIEGFEGALITYLNQDLTLILLSNIEDTDLRTFHKKIADLIFSWRN